MLLVEGLKSAYGTSQVLFNVGLTVGQGEAVSLLGRNGMGKTTTVKSIMGLISPQSGRISFQGRDIAGLAPHLIARAGIGLVPEGRQIFPNLTVHEQLIATAAPFGGRAKWTPEKVYRLFPILESRRHHWGNQLSGGEQQMLAIARALLLNPRLLLLDEASEGLAPVVRREIWEALARLKKEGESILVIDKHIGALMSLCDRHTIIEKGQTVWQGRSADLKAAQEVRKRYLGV